MRLDVQSMNHGQNVRLATATADSTLYKSMAVRPPYPNLSEDLPSHARHRLSAIPNTFLLEL